MQALKETTVWAEGKSAVNHTYLLSGDQMIAYIPSGTLEPRHFNKPIRIDRRGRRFEPADLGLFDRTATVDLSCVTVQGSRGQTYTVNLDLKTCTCPGYSFRGTCKHILEGATA
jgi:hypothetical protein